MVQKILIKLLNKYNVKFNIILLSNNSYYLELFDINSNLAIIIITEISNFKNIIKHFINSYVINDLFCYNILNLSAINKFDLNFNLTLKIEPYYNIEKHFEYLYYICEISKLKNVLDKGIKLNYNMITNLIYSPDRTYLYDDFEICNYKLYQLTKNFNQFIILKINTKNISIYLDANFNHLYYTYDYIPSEYINIIDDCDTNIKTKYDNYDTYKYEIYELIHKSDNNIILLSFNNKTNSFRYKYIKFNYNLNLWLIKFNQGLKIKKKIRLI
jgi:hypothetical protein